MPISLLPGRTAPMAGLVALLLHAAGAAAACPVKSAFELTVTPQALVFERAGGPARRIEMRSGALSDRGKAVRLAGADRERVLRFEQAARALLPRIRGLGTRAVDLMAVAVKEEAAATSPKSAANPKLNAQLAQRVADFKARIANSNTSREWHGNAFNRYAAAALVDVVPLVAGDLAQQALDATLRGEFSRAGALGERAAGVRAALERRIRARLAELAPDVEKLCPSLRRLDALESAVQARLTDGTRLDLLQVGR